MDRFATPFARLLRLCPAPPGVAPPVAGSSGVPRPAVTRPVRDAARASSARIGTATVTALVIVCAGPTSAGGQDVSSSAPAAGAASPAAAEAFGEEIMNQFEMSARKVVGLARAMPAETYGWQPMEGVASVARAYMHIAAYNYLYPETALGVAAPDGLQYQSWEEQVTDKERVVELLEGSMDHVRAVVADMSGEDLATMTRLYGREVPKWAVLLQLVTHMNEHLGQQIAYARSNGVVPPWSN